MIVYKIDVLKALKEKGYNTNVIRKNALISEGALTKLRHQEEPSGDLINRVCLLLRCQPNDIIEVVPSDEEKIKFF